MAIHNYSRQLTPFIGRETEIETLATLLQDPASRLLTLIGPGGIGKTRLAVEVARQLDFVDGIYFVPLQSLNSGDNLLSAIADALQIRLNDTVDPLHLYQYFRERQMLFILDNFEHLLKQIEVVTDILNATTQIKLMVTTRTRLNLQAEQIWPVRGLEMPIDAPDLPNHIGAVKLFVERAKRADPQFSLEEQSASVVKICQLVNGSPLALELAANWVSTMSCEMIAAEIQRSLDFLSTSQHDVTERHRSMRAVFDHTWRLLNEDEQSACRKLPVFRGGFTVEAATEVAGVSLQTLARLINKSLVQLDADNRYIMHELLRQYGMEKMAEEPLESDETRIHHVRYYADIFSKAQERFSQDLDQFAFAAIRLEIANLEEGTHWALQRSVTEDVSSYTLLVSYFYQSRGLIRHGEQIFHSWAALVRGHPTSVERDRALGCILAYLGWLVQLQMRNEEAIPLLEESLALLNHADSRRDFALALAFLGRIHRILGDFPRAITLLQNALATSRALDVSIGIWMSLGLLSEVSLAMGAYDEAQRCLEEGLKIHHTPSILAQRYNLSVLGLIHVLKGEADDARDRLLEAIRVNRGAPDVMPSFFMLAGIALYMSAQGKDVEAAEVLLIIANHPMADAERQNQTRPYLAKIQDRLSPETLAKAEQRAATALSEAQRSGSNAILATAYFDQLASWLEVFQSTSSADANRLLDNPLSSREMELLVLIAEGLTNQEVAAQLHIGVSTVKKHINHIYSKLGVVHRTEAVALARKLRILP